jgi:hypothetical protein
MLSAKELRELYGGRWLETLKEVADETDGGRERLVKHYPDLEHEQSLSLLLPRARAAVNDVVDEVEKRIKDFPARRVVRRGVLWRKLEKDFLAACAVVRGVSEAYCLAVETMLEDEEELPTELSISDPGRLSYLQRIYLNGARNLLEFRTGLFLDLAMSTFVGRSRASLLAGAASVRQ